MSTAMTSPPAASLLLVPALAQMLGLTAYGWADRVLGSYRVPVAIGALTTAGFLSLLAIAGTLLAAVAAASGSSASVHSRASRRS